jgi:hypothetical protein
MSNSTKKMILLVAMAVMVIAPAASADEWNQKTVFTFSGPVSIPGQVLPAGTYVFKLLDSPSNRHIVQVFNQDENHVFGTFLAIPDYHLKTSDKPLVKFHESPAGEPQAIKGWLYPGRNYGHEFVYPKNAALELARMNNTPVPAMPTELKPDTIMPDVKVNAPEVTAMVVAPLVAERPTGEEVALERDFMVEPESNAVQQPSEELPATASWLPLIAFAGLASLGTAITLRVAATVKANK